MVSLARMGFGLLNVFARRDSQCSKSSPLGVQEPGREVHGKRFAAPARILCDAAE